MPAVAPLAATLSAVLLAASLPPIGLAWLAGVALLPLLLNLSEGSAAHAIGCGASFGAATGVLLSCWLAGVLVERFGVMPTPAIALMLLVSATPIPANAIFALAVRSLAQSSCLYAPTVGLAWACVELSLARVWPGLPWLVLGAPLIDTPLAPLASVVGVHGVSAFAATSSALFAQLLSGRRMRPVLSGAAVTVATASLLGLAHSELRGRATELRIGLVQPGLPMGLRTHPGFQHAQLERLLALSDEANAAELIIWPESAFVQVLDERRSLRRRLQLHFERERPPLLAGGFTERDGQRHTAVLYFTHTELARVIYEKRRLVPIAEELPAWLGAAGRSALGRLAPPRSLARGRGRIGQGLPWELSLCYEAAFSESGADPETPLLINLANDGWYDDTAAAAHHFLLVRWRALERGAHLARAATTGISAFVAPSGEVVAKIGVSEAGTLTRTPHLQARITPFERWGYAPLVVAALLLSLWHVGCFLTLRLPRRRRGSTHAVKEAGGAFDPDRTDRLAGSERLPRTHWGRR